MDSRRLAGIIAVWMLLSACSSATVPKARGGRAALAETAEEAGYDPTEVVEIPSDLKILPVSSFKEIWGCLQTRNKDSLKPGSPLTKPDSPLTDIGYYGAEVDSYGHLTSIPSVKDLARFPGRKHLAIQCESRSLSHFVLMEGSQTRKQLVAEILAAVKDYDGLQVDFELVPAKDGDAFRSFLAELRAGLGKKVLSIAVPARLRVLANDVYDYSQISSLVDRIFVMAYDEHWSTSAPGSIASMNWCRRVAAHALKTVDPEKLIMGLPFYGRTWGHTSTFRAYYNSGIERIKKENNITEIRRENGIPTFKYEIPVSITVFYEDDYSIAVRMDMYSKMGVKNAGFWAIGQESPTVWNYMKIVK